MDAIDNIPRRPHGDAPPASPLDRLLTQREVSLLTTLSKRSLYRLLKDGAFPAPVRISKGRVAWRASAVAAWQRSPQSRAA